MYYGDVIMGAMASQITSHTIVNSNVYSGTDQRKHQSSAPLAFVRGFHRWPVNSPHKRPVTGKMFPFDDVIMCQFVSFNFLSSNCYEILCMALCFHGMCKICCHLDTRNWLTAEQIFPLIWIVNETCWWNGPASTSKLIYILHERSSVE